MMEVHMLKRSRRRGARQEAPPQPAPAPTETPAETPAAQSAAPAPSTGQEYAALGADAPIAWPSQSGRRVPVTGQLSPHAAAALKRMGITNE
jgi:hypothetical protein